MRVLALFILLCAGLVGLGAWRCHDTGPALLLALATAAAWRLWRSE